MSAFFTNIRSKIGIRWRLVFLFAVLISATGLIIGYTTYNNAERIVLQQIRYQLSIQSEDWTRLIESYVEEIKNIEHLEDTIVKAHLGNMSKNICNWIELSDEIHGGKNQTPISIRNKIYNYIAKIDVGKSGYVWVFGGEGEKRGTYIVSQDRKFDGENHWNMVDIDGRHIVKEVYKNTNENLKQPYIIKYHWGTDSLGLPLKKIAAVTYYKPWNIYIGVSAYYKDYQQVENQMKERLKNKIAEQIIGKTGYIYVIQGSGENMGHYIVSRKRQRDGENIWYAKDASGRYFIQDIVIKGKETPSEAYITTYPWQNIGEDKAYDKIAAITYVAEWDWIIGASAYHKDFLDPVIIMKQRALQITYIATIAAIIVAFLVGSYYAKTLTIPLMRLTKIADEMGKLDFYTKSYKPVRTSSKEIATLSQALERARQTQIELDNAEKEKSQLIEELEAKNIELERFTYTVSHDLRTPLVTIKGFLGVFKEDFKVKRYDDLHSHIRRIENAADTMQTLLSDLLELSRIGRMVNPSETFNTNDLVNLVLELLSAPINQSKVIIEVQGEMPPLFADRQRIMEVYQNLIENGIKYMGNQKEPKIEIGCMKNSTEDVYFVKDNGIGINIKYKEKVFSLFDQLNKNADGSGVGLALVKRIIEFHNGRIWFESEGIENKGTTFYFTVEKEKNKT